MEASCCFYSGVAAAAAVVWLPITLTPLTLLVLLGPHAGEPISGVALKLVMAPELNPPKKKAPLNAGASANKKDRPFSSVSYRKGPQTSKRARASPKRLKGPA
eukprot:1155333-Pelagomonas_calceolata.AAC.2